MGPAHTKDLAWITPLCVLVAIFQGILLAQLHMFSEILPTISHRNEVTIYWWDIACVQTSINRTNLPELNCLPTGPKIVTMTFRAFELAEGHEMPKRMGADCIVVRQWQKYALIRPFITKSYAGVNARRPGNKSCFRTSQWWQRTPGYQTSEVRPGSLWMLFRYMSKIWGS